MASHGLTMIMLLQFFLLGFVPWSIDAWMPPIVRSDYKFFDSRSRLEFRVRGMAYYPRANAGNWSSVTGLDYATDAMERVWKPHLKHMHDLGVNVVRLYSVDPTESHDKFMCEASRYGIYVLVGMSAPCDGCYLAEEAPPACYPDAMFTRAQMIYNAFAVYDNTLGFSVANEINLQHGGDTITSPCAKALIRDLHQYATTCAHALRHVPIGLDLADTLPRAQWLQYFDCILDNDVHTRADWIGFNQYVECDPVTHTAYAQSTGLQELMRDYRATGYARVLMFGEFGCNLGDNTVDGFPNQRTFHDAQWMNEAPDMTDLVVGGNAFEFSTELANLQVQQLTTSTSTSTSTNSSSSTNKTRRDAGRFGVGYFLPDNCDHQQVVCEYNETPEFLNLQRAYTSTQHSNVSLDTFQRSRTTNALTCPLATFAARLPPTPSVELLACSVRQPICDGTLSNAAVNRPLDHQDSTKSTGSKQGLDTSLATRKRLAPALALMLSLLLAVATYAAPLVW